MDTEKLEFKKVTSAQVRHWIGSDHLSVDELLELICEFANEEYDPASFRNDVFGLCGDTTEEDKEGSAE